MHDSVFNQGCKKHDGSLPLIDVNTFLPKDHGGEPGDSYRDRADPLYGGGEGGANVQAFHRARNALASAGETSHAHGANSTGAPQPVHPERSPQGGVEGRSRRVWPGLPAEHRARPKNAFVALMQEVKTHSLGQISHGLYDVGGEYLRNM